MFRDFSPLWTHTGIILARLRKATTGLLQEVINKQKKTQTVLVCLNERKYRNKENYIMNPQI